MASLSQSQVVASPVQERLRHSLRGTIEPVRLPLAYRFAIVLVAVAMLVLPVIYFGLVAYFALGPAWHAVRNRGWLASEQLPAMLSLLMYAAPLIIGPMLALFMIKPFFARRSWRQRPQRLKREAEPFLFEYVERVCAALEAPAPRSIRVTCEVNAAAAFRRGILSLFSNDLTLVVGLPLVSGLTLRQFTGVLAHELGHLAQGSAMRMTFLIARFNAWFGRAAYERDAWDEWMQYQSIHGDLRLRPLFYAARFFVWLNRWLMWSIMMLGHMISSYVSRQQEFDADHYSTRLVGGSTVGPTLRRTTELAVAFDLAITDLRQFWDEGRLADDLPTLIVANLEQVTPELRRELKRRERDAQTGVFDTHPADRDRAEAALRHNDAGIFSPAPGDEALPASVLFADYDRLAKATTLQFYRENVDQHLQPAQLHPVAALIERRQAEIETGRALRRYFQTRIPALRPLPIADDAADRPTDPERTGRELEQARRAMLDELPAYEQTVERYQTAESRLQAASNAMALLQADVRIKAGDFGLTGASRRAAGERARQVRESIETLAAQLLPFEEQAGQRLSAALQLLQLTRIQKRIEWGADLQREVQLFLPEARFVSGLMAELPTFRILLHNLLALFAHVSGNQQNAALHDAILSRVQAIRMRLRTLHDELGSQLYPFDHARADMTLREYALPRMPDEQDIAGLLQTAEQVCEKLVAVQMRLFARLAAAAEKVEAAVGLPPLPDPEGSDSSSTRRSPSSRRRKRAS